MYIVYMYQRTRKKQDIKACFGMLAAGSHRYSGGGDQFKGIGALAFPIGGAKVLALRKGTTRSGYHAFSLPDTADSLLRF